MKILNNVDLNQNQVKYALLHPTGTVPSDPKKGQVYFNTSSNKLFVWDGSNWVDCTSQGHAFETNTSNIKMNGTVSVGSLNTIPRADHVHPSDTSKVTANAAITGGQKCKITYDSKGLVTAGEDLAASDIPDLSSTYIAVSTKGAASGVASLDTNAKVPLSQLPDVVVGGLIYGGTVNASTAVATLTTNAKTKLGTTSATITLTNNTTAITGYVANEGIYYIVSTAGTFAGITFESGDWLLSNGQAWTKIDTSDAVTSVNGQTGAVVLDAEDVGALPDTTTYVSSVNGQSGAVTGIATTADLANKMDKANPTGTGSFSLNRKASTTIGNYSFAEGYDTTASGQYSHAEGNGTSATNSASHAEGDSTQSGGLACHAEGGHTIATGTYTHAEGGNTLASSYYAHAEGFHTVAQRKSQHVFGEYNTADSTGTSSTRGQFVEIVGNGTAESARSNARTLDWNGNETLAGNLQAAGLTNGTITKTMTQVLSAPTKITAAIDQASQTLSSGGTSDWEISNTIGSADVIVQVRDSSGNVVLPDINITSSTITISIVSATKLANNSYYATIIG